MAEDIDPETVRHIAGLARIDLDDEAAVAYATELESILEYFDSLDEVPEMDRETELVNVFRPDAVHEGIDHDSALQNAPESEDGYFKGPNVS